MNRNRTAWWLSILMILTLIFSNASALADTTPVRTVRVSCGINKALYLDDKGQPAGYCSEYLQEMAKINHWKLEYVEASWTDSVKNLADGTIDLLFPTQMTEARKETMGFSAAIGGYQPIGLFASADSPLCYDDYAGFDGARVALSKGTSNEAALIAYAEANGFTFTAVDMNTTEEKMAALADGRVDMIVFSTLNDVPEGKVVAMLDYLPFYYCTNIANTELLAELDNGMKQMIVRQPDLVQDVFYSFMNRNISFAYTAEEKAAIETHGSIIVGIYEDMAPLLDRDADGNFIGIYADLIARIEGLSGLDIQIKAIGRGEDAESVLRRGAVDFIMGCGDEIGVRAGQTEFVQSDGVMDYYTIGVTRTDETLAELDHPRFALTREKSYWEADLTSEYAGAVFGYYATTKDCLNAVQAGKADITLLNSWEYNYQSKNQRFENLMEWENTRTLSETVFTSLAGGSELIRSVLDKSIEQIANAEKEATITANLNRAYSSYDLGDRLYEMRNTLLIFGCVLLVLLVGFTVYMIMRRKAVHALEAKNRQLESANDAKDRFLSRMSHELRTPLNAIDGYAMEMAQDLEQQDRDDGRMRQHIASILRAAKYQLAIIGDLLDIQKIESGKLELVPVEVDSAAYLQTTVDMIRPEADEKHIDFSFERINSLSDTYLMDGVRFQQVLLNLLHNAMKFTPEGGKVKMTVEVVDQDETTNTLKFVVSDNGIGMSEDFQQHYLFHRFAQEYQGNTSPYEGCGTGLAISREIMHLMGGEITCKSEQGAGSTFTVILTVRHVEKKRKRAARKAYPVYDLSGVRVLLCEDNKMNQDIERRLLERMKCEVDIADDGQIGVDKFTGSAAGYYSVVLMDIRMPNLDGLEAARAMRAADRTDAKTIPILAVSANTFEEDVQKSLTAGMNEHLAKPVDARILYEKISTYCKCGRIVSEGKE